VLFPSPFKIAKNGEGCPPHQVLSSLAKKLRFAAMFSEEIASKPAPLNRPLA
jgi:hypothetical protein